MSIKLVPKHLNHIKKLENHDVFWGIFILMFDNFYAWSILRNQHNVQVPQMKVLYFYKTFWKDSLNIHTPVHGLHPGVRRF